MDMLMKKLWKKLMISKKSSTSPAAPPASASSATSSSGSLAKSKSLGSFTTGEAGEKPKRKPLVAPQGCFSVYVGPQKERFLVRTELANHPLFKTLLDAAETEYGFSADGPILIPCDVDLFYRVLAEMEDNGGGDGDGDNENTNIGCCSPLVLYTPTRRSADSIGGVGKRSYSFGSYRLLGSSRLLKLNR